MSSFTIMQWNACGLLAHINELKNYLSNVIRLPDVICVQESFLKPRKSFKMDSYEVVRKDRLNSDKGGLVTLVKASIGYKIINTPGPIENLVIEINLNGKVYNIANVYISPTQNIIADDLEAVFKLKNAIVIGDFNAHSPSWKSDDLNNRGRVLEALLDKFSYVVCNTGTPTYQKVRGGGSVLDLSIVSSSIAMTCTWSALNTTLGSDHCPTFLTIGAIGDSGEDWAARPKWKCHKADWSLYRALCKDSITSNLVVDDINVFNENIVSAIKEAANKSIPKTSGTAKGRAKKKPLPYWTPECTKAIKLRNTTRNKFNKSKNPLDGAHYRKLKGMAQRTIKDTAKQHWQSLCDSFDTNTKLGTVWRIFKKMQGTGNQHIIPTLTGNVNSNKEKADLFAATFAANSDDSNFDQNFIERKKDFELNHKEEFAASFDDDETSENALNIAFSLKELKNVLNQCKKKTSPGADTIHYEMLKELPGECLDVLLTLYNLVYSSGMLPTEWNHAIVLPIRKLEKNPTQPNSYRPISLTSCVCKIMEKLVTNRLTWFLESNNLLNNAQAGFRRGRSTADQIVKLQDTIHKHNRSRGFTVGVFLDFEKAYDMLWRPGLLCKIKQLGIRANMFKFVKAFISERTFQVQVGSVLSEIAVQQNGTPQGSIISPMLFLIMINDLKLNIPGVELSLFADDSATYKSV
jgi:hypothetical protein